VEFLDSVAEDVHERKGLQVNPFAVFKEQELEFFKDARPDPLSLPGLVDSSFVSAYYI